VKFDTLLEPTQRRALIAHLLTEGEDSIEDLSSKKMKMFKSDSNQKALTKTVRYLEFALNHHESMEYDTYQLVEKKPVDLDKPEKPAAVKPGFLNSVPTIEPQVQEKPKISKARRDKY
jgi:hypothetical protein